MALNIKNPTAVSLAKELSEATGDSMTQVIINALRNYKIDMLKHEEKSVKEKMKLMQSYVDRYQRGLLKSHKTREEIDDEMYDEYGLPK